MICETGFKLGVKEGVMDVQSGESQENEVIDEGIGESRKWRNWCQNGVDEKTKGADYKDKV